jgi:heme exporter protein B
VLASTAGIIARDLRLAFRRKGDVAQVLVFFVIVASLFPLGTGAEPNQLRAMGPGVVWVAALLAALLSLGRLFAADYADGSLEQMMIAAHPLAATVAGKTIAHWLTTGLPLTLLAPLLGVQYDLPPAALGALVASLALGTPVLSLIGGVGAALTLGTRGAAVLLALLVLPLYVPVLVFGAGAVGAALAGLPYGAHLSLLGAFLAFSLVFAPWASCAALRIALD